MQIDAINTQDKKIINEIKRRNFGNITLMIDNYIYEKDWHKDIRFDIIGVYKNRTGAINFRHFEDAFY